MKSTKRNVLIVIIAVIFLIIFCPFAYLSHYEGKVIDADNKNPIKGAVVLVVYYGTAYTVAGSNSYEVDAREITTDDKGEFSLQRKIVWFKKAKWFPEGSVTIIKPGYGIFPDHKRADSPGFNATWPPPDQYIVYELPMLNRFEEREKNVKYSNKYHDIPYQKRKLYFNAINEERKSIGLHLLSIPVD